MFTRNLITLTIVGILLLTVIIIVVLINSIPHSTRVTDLDGITRINNVDYEKAYIEGMTLLEKHLSSLPSVHTGSIEVFPCPVYYINLDSNPERNAFMIKQFEYYGVNNAYRVQAVDGRQNGIPSYLNGRLVYNLLDMRPTENACTLSHIKAIAQAYYDGCETAIILEDDAYFMHARLWEPNALRKIMQNAPSDWCILNLLCPLYCNFDKPPHDIGPCQFANEDYIKFEPPFKGYSSAVAYIVTRRAMTNILNAVQYFDKKIVLKNRHPEMPAAADWLIYDWAGKSMYFVKPTTFMTHNDCGLMQSTIENKCSNLDLVHKINMHVLNQYTRTLDLKR